MRGRVNLQQGPLYIGTVAGLFVLTGIWFLWEASGTFWAGAIALSAGCLIAALLGGVYLGRWLIVNDTTWMMTAGRFENALAYIPARYAQGLVNLRGAFRENWRVLGLTWPDAQTPGTHVVEQETSTRPIPPVTVRSLDDIALSLVYCLHVMQDVVRCTMVESTAAVHVRAMANYLTQIGRLLNLPLPEEATFGEAMTVNERRALIPRRIRYTLIQGRTDLAAATRLALLPQQQHLLLEVWDLLQRWADFLELPYVARPEAGAAFPIGWISQVPDILLTRNVALATDTTRFWEMLGIECPTVAMVIPKHRADQVAELLRIPSASAATEAEAAGTVGQTETTGHDEEVFDLDEGE